MSKDLIKQLEEKIDNANTAYHVFGSSELSDAEYDALKDMLAKLDPKNSRIKQVGAVIPDKVKKEKQHWEKYVHKTYKMGSIDKVNYFNELTKWANNLDYKKEYIVEEKLDGISIKLIYINGELNKAITRGNDDSGESIGEDITKNVKKMKNVISQMPKCKFKEVVIRGEIILYKSNAEFVGGKTLRNSAAGAAKELEGKNCCYLNVKIYTIMNWKELGFSRESECLKFLKDNNFDVVSWYECSDLNQIENIYQNYIDKTRKQLDWDIDGLVIKTNEIQDDKWDLPERARAYKFPHEKGITKLLDVIWQDSGGRISPVAILEPIMIGGVTISRATLNNLDFISNLNVKINDFVIVSRRNDVIPCIEGVSISAKDGKVIKPPTHDDEGFPIIHETNSEGKELVYLISTNPNSKQKKIREILHWYKAHDAKGIAEETIDLLLTEKIVKSLPEFYDLGLNGNVNLTNLDGFGAGKFKILNKATLLTSNTNIIKFMEGIDISGFGSSRFEAILEYNNKKIDISSFLSLCSDINYISQIPGFGINTAKSLEKSIKEKNKLIQDMLTRIKVDDWTPEKKASTKINGLSFCFTGEMTYNRDELEKSVKKNGGLVAGVSKKLDYLVVNDLNSSSNKNQKAIQLNIKRISEQEYLNMIGGSI